MAFIVFALLYLLALGTFFATFMAVEFEAVGHGAAAATKCMFLVCASNVSSELMAPLDGWLHDRFEPLRVCRRLQLLRRWSLYEQDDEQVCA